MSLLLKNFVRINQNHFVREISRTKIRCHAKRFSTVTEATEPSVRAVYCKLDSPQQTFDHEGMMYVLPKEHSDKLFKMGDGFNREHEDYFAYNGETAVMIRRPALEIINLLERTNFDKPVNRYVICK